jgi:anaerobic magnesium-protoporphyrin IX monomethyl ester cyclase
MTTRILLVFPNPTSSSPQKSPPLSILSVGEALKSAKSRGKSDENYEVKYYDERYDDLPDLSWPDVVGVSSMTGQLKGTIKWLQLAKAAGKRTILGGAHVSMMPEQCLEEDFVDCVVVGEGENAIIEAIHGGYKQKIQSPITKSKDYVSPVNYDTLPYFQRSSKVGDTMLLTSRGCFGRCAFCYSNKFYNRHWLSVDLDRWRSDILYLKENAGLRNLEHGDDWAGTWVRAREIVRFLQDNGITYHPSFRANQINDDVAQEMHMLGLTHVSIGMESGNERVLKLIQKDITLEDQIRTAESFARHNIWPMYYFVFNFPTETRDEIYQTLDLADRLMKIHKGKATEVFFAYRATPGTSLWDMVDQSTLPKNMHEWSNFDIGYTNDEFASAVYTIGGLAHHRSKGDKTDKNFPGLSRALIYPFEVSASYRWKHRIFGNYAWERTQVDKLLKWASSRKA